jgi:hypothetical protein
MPQAKQGFQWALRVCSFPVELHAHPRTSAVLHIANDIQTIASGIKTGTPC